MSTPATPIKILLVEDNPKYRQVITKALQREARFELVGPALGSAERALVQLERTNSIPPDVILLDLYLPGVSGTAAIPSLLSLAPKAKIIVLSQSNREADVVGAIAAGAAGYLLKSSHVRRLNHLEAHKDMEFCIRQDEYKTVPVFRDGAIRLG